MTMFPDPINKAGETYEPAKTNPLLASWGLNWEVQKQGIQTASGVAIDDHYAIVRLDNNLPLGIIGETYIPFQNYDMAELLDRLGNKVGREVHKAGSFGGGQKVFMQLKGDSLNLNYGSFKDEVQGFLTCVNSHDGSTSLRFGNSSVTISCGNTFFHVLHALEHNSVRHTSNMKLRVENIIKALENEMAKASGNFDTIKKLSEAPMTKASMLKCFQIIFDIQDPEAVYMEASLGGENKLSTRKINTLAKFDLALNKELAEKGQTLWGLFSGVTRFSTHEQSKGDNTEAKIFGSLGQRERALFRSFENMVA